MTPEQRARSVLASALETGRILGDDADAVRAALAHIDALEARATAAEQQLSGFEPYLKEGETPLARLERERKDCLALMGLLAKEKERANAAEQRVEQAEQTAAGLRQLVVRLDSLLSLLWYRPSTPHDAHLTMDVEEAIAQARKAALHGKAAKEPSR